MTITGLGSCYKCGKPAAMAINLLANAAGGAGSYMVPACEDCHPSPFTIAQRENERLRRFLEIAVDAYEDEHGEPNSEGHWAAQARKLLGH